MDALDRAEATFKKMDAILAWLVADKVTPVRVTALTECSEALRALLRAKQWDVRNEWEAAQAALERLDNLE